MTNLVGHLMLATGEEVANPQAWSGIPYSMREALERRVDRLTIFQPPPPARPPLDLALRLALGARRYPLWITPATLRSNARALRAAIAQHLPDAVLSIAGMCVAALGDPPVPTYLFSDAPYEAFHEAYRGTIDRPFLLRKYQKQETIAARQLDGLCYSSAWAVGEGRRLFGPTGRHGAPMESLLHVTEMGSNWVPGMSRDELLTRVDARPKDRVDLLFLGRDWERKGGPLAVEVTRLLREAGVAATLHVVGCKPEIALDYVTLHGALYRTDAAQAATLSNLFLDSHFLLTPTTAECFGLAFGEAQAFALPPISRAVQALPAVVVDGVTGLLFDSAAEAPAYVARILALREDPTAYRRMAVAARDRFETLLNWDAMAGRLLEIIAAGITARGRVTPP